VFLDLKLFEIPNSVAGAVRVAGTLGAAMVTVHGMGGIDIMAAAVAAARDFPRLRVLALTVVTSMTSSDLADLGINASTESRCCAWLSWRIGLDAMASSHRRRRPRSFGMYWLPAP
jgi:orotidine-5'-phosphate decarboxylase